MFEHNNFEMSDENQINREDVEEPSSFVDPNLENHPTSDDLSLESENDQTHVFRRVFRVVHFRSPLISPDANSPNEDDIQNNNSDFPPAEPFPSVFGAGNFSSDSAQFRRIFRRRFINSRNRRRMHRLIRRSLKLMKGSEEYFKKAIRVQRRSQRLTEKCFRLLNNLNFEI